MSKKFTLTEYLNESNLGALLEKLYPNGNWIKDKRLTKEEYEVRAKKNKIEDPKLRNFRPDYRSENLSIVVEFDGIQHYQSSDVFWNDIEKIIYYEELGYKFIQIPYYIQPTKEAIEVYFGIQLEEDLTTKKNGFNMENNKLNKNLPSSFSEDGVRRFIAEFNKLKVETQAEILETLYDNYYANGTSLRILPLSLIEFLQFQISEEDKQYNLKFKLSE